MLPKVANHLLHQTARAAAAAPAQTGHTLRNVLQSSGSPSGSLTAWGGVGSSSYGGGTGAGAGGAKYHAGSRAYNGYTGAGRAVTQANSSQDSGLADDTDERTAQLVSFRSVGKAARGRGSGLILRGERGVRLGVLSSVQSHVRLRHTFAVGDARPTSDSADVAPDTPRHNSTLALADAEPVAPPYPRPPTPSQGRKSSEAIQEVLLARDTRDPAKVVAAVMNFRTNKDSRNVEDWNIALQSLYHVRVAGEPLTVLLDTYNDMISRALAPTFKTYAVLINALCDRDHEVHKVIISLNLRMKRRALGGRIESAQQGMDQERVKKLESENNFGSAMSLFQAASVLYGAKIFSSLYTTLLRSCAIHANVDAAIHIYAHLESRADVKPSPLTYGHLIDCYTNAGDLQGAKEIFTEFRQACAANRVEWVAESKQFFAALGDDKRSGSARAHQLTIWNKMIESYFRCGEPAGALGLLEQMMDSQAGEAFGPTEVPPPSSSTFGYIITGFCQSGDIPTALAWFERLLKQDMPSVHPYASSATPNRPDYVAWRIMLDNLAQAEMADDFNRLFKVLVNIAARDGIEIRAMDHILLARVNSAYLNANPDVDDARALELIDFVMERAYGSGSEAVPPLHFPESRNIVSTYLPFLLDRNRRDKAVELIELWALYDAKQISALEGNGWEEVKFELEGTRRLLSKMVGEVLRRSDQASGSLSFATFAPLAQICELVGAPIERATGAWYLQLYADAKAAGTPLNLSVKQWEHLVKVSSQLEDPTDASEVGDYPRPPGYSFEGTASLIDEMAKAGVDPAQLEESTVGAAVRAIARSKGAPAARDLLTQLGPAWSRFTEVLAAEATTTPVKGVAEPEKSIRVDVYHSRFVDEFFPTHRSVTPMMCYERFEAGVKDGVYPTPEAIGRLINALGRLHRLDLVNRLYSCGQLVLEHLAKDQSWQSVGWFQIEDQMIIALAHAGEYEAAYVHRTRIIEQGGTPSADAYGALIAAVRDTTDDATNGLKLFQEAQMHSVKANVFLYNTIISKLAKARKVDYALELFQQMKTAGFQPTPVSYGAVIAACARVGDAHSAEILFHEMASRPNFKARVPPYNTMMQLYAHTKPDRERVLSYHKMLLASNVKPTAHTYKLLMDAYGTIQPIDLPSMERVFEELVADRGVEVNGTHWASLINAHGCVAKDVDAAIRVFESIPNHPSSARAKEAVPDAIAFEALINVLVTLRRTDLIPTYTRQLLGSRVHMTAYIANFLIKGHAAAGDMDAARQVFESLVDPAEGVAAPNNHAPHEAAKWTAVPHDAPVYREPSTWEAMFRAELGSNNRENALALLERLKTRQYPQAVYARIAGIMLNDSVSPWPSPDGSNSS